MFPWRMPLVNPPYRTLPPPSARNGRAVSVRRALRLKENTATERSNVALFCLSAADVYSGKSECLFRVVLDIVKQESLPIAVIPDIIYRESICALSLQRWIPANYFRG